MSKLREELLKEITGTTIKEIDNDENDVQIHLSNGMIISIELKQYFNEAELKVEVQEKVVKVLGEL